MREIPTTNYPRLIQVDDEDYDYLSLFTWRTLFTKYGRPRLVVPTTTSIGRVLLQPPTHLEVDHIDRDPFNNQRHNLQAISKEENLARRQFNAR